jgi:hypothetical protein
LDCRAGWSDSGGNPRFVDLARSEVSRLGFQNVAIIQAGALASGHERESFDLVHERLVLVNVPQPSALAHITPGAWPAAHAAEEVADGADGRVRGCHGQGSGRSSRGDQ